MRITSALPSVLCAAAMSLATASVAQQIPQIDLRPMVVMGGQFHAAAEKCKHIPASELAAMKAKQKSTMIADGTITAADFDQHFKQGHDKAQAHFKTMSADQVSKMCQELAKAKP